MKKATKESFIEKANQIWNSKFDYSEVEYKGSLTDIKVICPIHGEFITKPQWHLQKSQCPECSKTKRIESLTKFNQESKRLSNEDWILKAKKVHGDKFDYSKTNYVNAREKITIICPNHGEQIMLPHYHIKGYGCPVCGKQMINVNNKLTQQEFLEIIKSKNIPNVSFEKTQYTGKRNSVIVTCNIHGDYETTAEVLLKGCGCKKCASDKLSIDRTITTEEFIRRAKLTHGDLYDYHLVKYTGAFDKVDIICKKHDIIFSQTANSHINRSGCPICNTSRGEYLIYTYLLEKEIKFVQEKTFEDLKFQRKLKFDFYLPKYNCIIEYDGEQHFKSVEYWGGDKSFKELQLKDTMKNEYCKLNNIRLLRIRYDNIDIVGTINNFLLHLS